MAAAKKNGLTLRITGPDGSFSEAVPDTDSVIVGSGAQAAVKLLDPDVSNLHCMLKVGQNGVVTAIDLGSESGTKVGGQTLAFPTPLKHGDVLHMGASRIEIFFGTAEVAAAPAGARAIQASAFRQGHHDVLPEITVPSRPMPPPLPMSMTARAATVANVDGKSVVTRPATIATTVPGLAPRRTVNPVKQVVAKSQRAPHLRDPLPTEAQPTAALKVLQVGSFWGDQAIDVQHFGEGRPVQIGDGKNNDFFVHTDAVGKRLALAVSLKDRLELRVPANAGVIVTEHGNVHSKEALRANGKLSSDKGGKTDVFHLGLHQRAEVNFGDLAFVLRYVKPSPQVEAKQLDKADFTFFKIAAVSILAFAALIIAIALMPKRENTANDLANDQQVAAKFLITPQKKAEATKLQKAGVEEGAKAKDEEGKFGKEEAKKEEADPSKPGALVVDKNTKEKDRTKVNKVGLLGAFAGLNAKGATSDVFGPGGLGTGINNALGGLKGGAGLGDAKGVGGMGSRGSGTGGGGAGLGLGGLGTQGTGRGAGGSGGIDLGGRGKEVTKIIPGRTTVVGGLDKDVIQKVIRRHQREIQYCYESELNKKPDLAGKVAVAFTIDATGSIADASVSESTLQSTPAEQCMISRIKRWKFPEPKGGGVVAVTYPWMFARAGSDSGE